MLNKNLEIYNKSSHSSDLSLRLIKVECTEGLLVDFTPFHRIVRTMMQRAAKAKVTHKEKIYLPSATNQ